MIQVLIHVKKSEFFPSGRSSCAKHLSRVKSRAMLDFFDKLLSPPLNNFELSGGGDNLVVDFALGQQGSGDFCGLFSHAHPPKHCIPYSTLLSQQVAIKEPILLISDYTI